MKLAPSRYPFVLWYGTAALLLAVFIQPMLHPDYFTRPLPQTVGSLAVTFALATLPPLAAWLATRGLDPARATRVSVAASALVLACLCELLHFYVVDKGHYMPVHISADNTEWQRWLHAGVVRLDPGFIPHCYRFLPDSIVQLLMWLTDDYELSRSLYRIAFNAMLFVVLFRFARRYVTELSAAMVVLMVSLVYPVTLLRYAGQLVDPLSHLSFALCLLALSSRYEPAFGPSLLVGLFAKESVLIMALCRAFYGPSRWRSLLLAGVYSVAAVAVVAGIRLFVNHGSFSYGNVSGVGPEHIKTNLGQYREWGPLYLFTIGIFVPGTVLGFRHVELPLRATLGVVLTGLIVSSAIFSWLSEVRNLMPAVFIMAVINMRYIELRMGARVPGAPEPAENLTPECPTRLVSRV